MKKRIQKGSSNPFSNLNDEASDECKVKIKKIRCADVGEPTYVKFLSNKSINDIESVIHSRNADLQNCKLFLDPPISRSKSLKEWKDENPDEELVLNFLNDDLNVRIYQIIGKSSK